MKRLLSSLLCLSVALVATSAASRCLAETVPGIASEKPAEGPFVKVDEGYMVPYTFRIPGTDQEIEMVPVPGGEFLLGSPEGEEDRSEDEGPQVKVTVDPMWVAKTEVTWGQYKEYMNLYAIFKDFEAEGIRPVNDDNKVDAITAPTELYEPTFTFEYGQEPEQPAVTMTQYSAQQFTKWLSLVSGQQYRLPTEAEWEYAARAGTKTAYSWGDSTDEIDDYAWYFDNADEGQVAVASKKPNAFGLYDMHGNVAEWTVNAYTEDGYASFAEKKNLNATDVVVWPEYPSPCVLRGGSWEFDPEDLRSAARLASDYEEWKVDDPNFPRSPWWLTSDPSRGVGFRIFRSYKPLGKEKITKFWEAQAEDTILDVKSRIDGGRGGLGLVDKDLPKAIEEAK
ncbi:formylglycine-generating enzyme family protein [Roseiconus lacunae]|uniref:Formylglycine-generating enzyme family protein n=1 Tax=Roseiconus lacunae TaxID=2605694 RepID=A0ABT7PIQ2_9BACT|nr:formylglycine-generating enzyme family protein [Roseiconus lacunae]MCD0458495.1 formylglycine-generating enzyme family protein [Roseiconus lacunae]MDM4016382.1 formylglycine-generating enzyme family protein [Roseiconus lacunae]